MAVFYFIVAKRLFVCFFLKSKYVDLRITVIILFFRVSFTWHFPTSVTFVMIVPILHLTIPIVFHSLPVLVIYDKFMLGTKASIIHTKVRKN